MKLKNRTYEQLKQRIITNKLEAGQKLYEKDLMQEYRIGRTPLRDILHELERDGLIEIIPKLGTKIASMNLKELRETVQIRRELEGFAAGLAALNITPEQLQELRKLLDDAHKIKVDDPDSILIMNDIDTKIHYLIYKATGNGQLPRIIKVLLDKTTMYTFQVGFSPSEFKQELCELEMLYEAMVKRNPVESRKIMKDHIQHFAKLMTSNLF